MSFIPATTESNNTATLLIERDESVYSTAEEHSLWSILERKASETPLSLTLCAVAVVLLGWLAWPVLAGRVYVADDLGEFHLPLRAFYAEQLSRGEAFDWCPNLYCGYYMTGEGQVGGYHPLHLLLYRSLPLRLAFGLECWLSYPAMLIGTCLLLRRRLRREAALFGAIVFTFGSFNLLHFIHPNAIAIIAQLPWLLLALDVLLTSPQRRHQRYAFAAVALLTGSQILLGYPQYVLYSLLVEVAFISWIALTSMLNRSDCAKRSAAALLAILAGLLVGGIQLMPTFESLQLSDRQNPTSELATEGSLHPLNTIQLIEPYLFTSRVVGQNTHELALYFGAVPLVLAIFGFVHRSSNRRIRSLQNAAAVTALIAIFWAFGQFGPFAWAQANIPLLNIFRFPCRAIVIFQFATMVLAAIGLMELIDRRSEYYPEDCARNRLLWCFPLLSIALAAAGVALWPHFVSSLPLIAAGPTLLFLAVILVRQAAAGSAVAISLLVLLSGFDLATYGFSTNGLTQTDSLTNFIATTSAPPDQPNTRVVLDGKRDDLNQSATAPRIGNRILLKGWKRADGYAGLEPAHKLDDHSQAALQVAGVGWQFTSDEIPAWQKLVSPLPRVRLVTDAVVSQNPSDEIANTPIGSTALVDHSIELSPGPVGQATVQIDRPGKIVVETQSAGEQLLVVNESFHPGWQATIDSQTSTAIRVNGDFLGVVVPAGTHVVSIEFRPESLRIGRIVSAFGLGYIVAVLLWPFPVAPQSSPYSVSSFANWHP